MLHKKGFTLVELLIVIALIAIIAGAVVLVLNPARQFAGGRNSQRWSHLNTLANSIQQNAAENRGTFTCAAGVVPIAATTMMSAAGGYNICGCLVPNNLPSLPFDPSAAGAGYTDCTNYNTGYTVVRDAATGRITVAAPGAEIGAAISVSR